MREFIVRARKAPVDADKFLAAVGSGAHVEYLAQMIVNALFIAKGHRRDTTLTLVLEDSADYSRALIMQGSSLGSLYGMNESALLNTCATALRAGRRLGKETSLVCDDGIVVTAISFEHLVKEKALHQEVYMLDVKGVDIRDTFISDNAVFLLTDHIPMPKKTFNSLARQGVMKLSLGPVMLHASQCISVIHNELDRLGC
ncbi:MAG: tRNA (pseudouridine(54)-N(1))-methyltransferase TrmY [Proteobacteria bacterium]|nr:tRNA (pseudouridine(54)-N(1))-methyltransferase TrmY [Pseudomonadota bacterium]